MNETETDSQLQRTELERDQASALGCSNGREEKGVERVSVKFTSYRRRLLDDDNIPGGFKDLLDGLKHAHLIHDDSPKFITLQTGQVKVQTRKEERTEIIIEYP